MIQTEEIQAIFLQWFKHHGVRSIQQIRLNVKNLGNSYEFEGNALYQIFTSWSEKDILNLLAIIPIKLLLLLLFLTMNLVFQLALICLKTR